MVCEVRSYPIASFTDDGFTVARVQKRWLSWGDTYEISIASGYDEVNVLAVVLVIDACLAAQNSST